MNLVNIVRKTRFVVPEALRRVEAFCISFSINWYTNFFRERQREHYVGVDIYFVVNVIPNVKLTWIQSKTKMNIFNLFFPAVLTENIWKVWDSHKTQLYCSQIGPCFFIELLVRQHVSAPSLSHHQVYKIVTPY